MKTTFGIGKANAYCLIYKKCNGLIDQCKYYLDYTEFEKF